MAETFAEQKKQLLSLRENYKQALRGNVEGIKGKLLGKQRLAMLVVSGLVVGLVAYRGIKAAFSKDKTKKRPKELLLLAESDEAGHVVYLDEHGNRLVPAKEKKKKGIWGSLFDSVKRELGALLMAVAQKQIRQALNSWETSLAKKEK